MVTDFASHLQKTHNLDFEPRRLCYRWHRWYDRIVLTRKAAGAHAAEAYLCKLPEDLPYAVLTGIPQWMFEPTICAAMQLAEMPHVDCVALRLLKSTIAEQRSAIEAAVLQPQLSRQPRAGAADNDSSEARGGETTGAVRRESGRTVLGRSGRGDSRRGEKASGATADQCAGKQDGLQSHGSGAAR